MAGRGPAPKPAQLRQRRNRKPGAAILPALEEVQREQRKAPPLPNPDKRTWHRLTRAWWRRVWGSPMAGEYLPTDLDGLGRLALLVDDYYKADDPKLRKELSVEIRLQEARYGLSPVDRSRLHWEIAKGEEAERQRRRSAVPHAGPKPGDDPRRKLGLVK